MSTGTVLITGANRGIGLEFAKRYAERGWTVVAAVRDPSSMPKLESKGEGKVVVVKIDAGSTTDAKEAVAELKSKYNINKLDVVIANAAINITPASFKDMDIGDLEETFRVNG